MSSARKLPFCLAGRLEGYELGREGKVRLLSIEVSESLYPIKLTQASRVELLRGVLDGSIHRGSWIEVMGQQKIASDGTVKSLKAEWIRSALSTCSLSAPNPMTVCPQRKSSQTPILVCQKSSCRKRGSARVQKALEQALGDRQLSEQVCVKAVGCLKQCDQGPNLVIHKTRYRNVALKDLGALLDEHFTPLPCQIAEHSSSRH